MDSVALDHLPHNCGYHVPDAGKRRRILRAAAGLAGLDVGDVVAKRSQHAAASECVDPGR